MIVLGGKVPLIRWTISWGLNLAGRKMTLLRMMTAQDILTILTDMGRGVTITFFRWMVQTPNGELRMKCSSHQDMNRFNPAVHLGEETDAIFVSRINRNGR